MTDDPNREVEAPSEDTVEDILNTMSDSADSLTNEEVVIKKVPKKTTKKSDRSAPTKKPRVKKIVTKEETTEDPIVEEPVTSEYDILASKIKELVPAVDSRDIQRAISVHKKGGTVAISNSGRLVFLPSKSPDQGGKEVLSRSGRIKSFLIDL